MENAEQSCIDKTNHSNDCQKFIKRTRRTLSEWMSDNNKTTTLRKAYRNASAPQDRLKKIDNMTKHN